ncbi:hypothetical protein DPMN_081861 [Dreissena polymorpha]|uniref:Uncharacterized protein n=1 Tax=Dreissena polymorpha TaxID=45954 RepID=A0A9D3Y8X2_DREPO|nr:hypothetical protein DPMN_081861 [Dreissena polymorpha]
MNRLLSVYQYTAVHHMHIYVEARTTTLLGEWHLSSAATGSGCLSIPYLRRGHTWTPIHDAIQSNEVFRSHYKLFRNDRGTLGDGVFVGVHEDLIAEQKIN